MLITNLDIQNDVRRDKPIERKWIDRSISVNHEHVFVERRVHTNNILDLVVNFELQRVHRCVEMDLDLEISHQRGEPNYGITNLVQEMHEHHLRITFTTISGSSFL